MSSSTFARSRTVARQLGTWLVRLVRRPRLPTLGMLDAPAEVVPSGTRAIDLLSVRTFAVALAALLGGYMFLGRGFAHLGLRPVYVGEMVLALGIVAFAFVLARRRVWEGRSRIVWLLLAFMSLGALRTLPYVPEYGIDAFRDAVLWGYATFALILYVAADKAWLAGSLRLYGVVIPVFALWLPVSWNLASEMSATIDPTAPGSNVPLVYFKGGDMAVHVVGAIAFLVLGTRVLVPAATLLWRAIVAFPLSWTVFATATASRGAFLASAAGLMAILFGAGRSRTWLPVIVSASVLVVTLFVSPTLPLTNPINVVSPQAGNPPSSAPQQPPEGTAGEGRETTPGQLVENVLSIMGGSGISTLDGTREFRLRWWGTIVDYTIFGPNFWTGKGFGINLADDDGFQPTADGSLRAPHNSHMTVLARMGVPGLILWLLLQAWFAVGLIRATLHHRRARAPAPAAIGCIILAYWVAMMVDTSFDPYLEGPQGGIWFWTLFGLGLVVIRLAPRIEGEDASGVSLPSQQGSSGEQPISSKAGDVTAPGP